MAPSAFLPAAYEPAVLSSTVFLVITLLLLATNKTVQKWLLDALKTRRELLSADFAAGKINVQYGKDKKEIYSFPTTYDDKLLVLPPTFIDSFKALPESVCNFTGSLRDMLLAPHTYSGDQMEVINVSMRQGFTKNLNKIMMDIYEENKWVMSQELPHVSKEGWQEWHAFPHCQRIIGSITGRVFIGPEINRSNDYMEATVGYSESSLIAGNQLFQYHPALRPLIKYIVPSWQDTKARMKQLERLIQPVWEQRRRMLAAGEDPPQDLITWNLLHSAKTHRTTLQNAVIQQLAGSQAAIHTTSMLLTNTIYQIAGRPEYQEPLREEIESVLAGREEGPLTVRDMTLFVKLDSFMRETHRLTQAGMLTMMRKWYQDFTLPDGTVIKKGAHTVCPSIPPSLDPDNFEDPLEFDGFRFQRMRQQPGRENQHQFVATGHDHLPFGHGNHGCPGRNFASFEIKSVVIYLLRNYDMKLPDGRGPPPQIQMGTVLLPAPTQQVLLKKRS